MTTDRKTKIVQMEARELEIHPHAQRKINLAKLKAQREKFDIDAIGVIHAVQYVVKGKLRTYVVDGQHRVKNLLALGLGEWLVDVMIHLDVTDDARAAQLFLELNDRANVSAYSKFRNEVIGGLSPAVDIAKLLESRGLTISTHPGEGLVRCVHALKIAYALDEGRSLTTALDTILAAWGPAAGGLDGYVVQGIALVYAGSNGSIDRTSMVRRLGQFAGGGVGILGAARGRKAFRHQAPIADCVAEVVVDAYNVKRTTRRVEWQMNHGTKRATNGRS
jgi:hypothetical protein